MNRGAFSARVRMASETLNPPTEDSYVEAYPSVRLSVHRHSRLDRGFQLNRARLVRRLAEHTEEPAGWRVQ